MEKELLLDASRRHGNPFNSVLNCIWRIYNNRHDICSVYRELSLKQKAAVIGIGLIGLIILYVGFYSVLDTVIFSKSGTASYRQRERFNTRAWNAFISSILLGVGYKQVRGSSIILSILGQTGILGLISYTLFNLSFVRRNRYTVDNNPQLYSAVKLSLLSLLQHR